MKDRLLQDIQKTDTSLAIQVAQNIQNLIVKGTLSCGEKLPSEGDLQEQLNVGRSVVREAIKILVARHVLEIRRGKGTFVANQPGMIDDPFGFAFEPDQEKLIEDLLQIRFLIEPLSASLAAQNATEENIQTLRDTVGELVETFTRNENPLEFDIQLHMEIAKSSQNLVIAKLVPIIIYSIRQIDPMCISFFGPEKAREMSIRRHKELVDAICARDPKRAEESMREQLDHHRVYFTNNL